MHSTATIAARGIPSLAIKPALLTGTKLTKETSPGAQVNNPLRGRFDIESQPSKEVYVQQFGPLLNSHVALPNDNRLPPYLRFCHSRIFDDDIDIDTARPAHLVTLMNLD